MIHITLPDGARREYPGPLTVGEVAASIGPGLAKAALAGKVDGRVVDLSHRIESDAQLAIVTDKDADGLEMIRHSTAHLLAYAVKELFPDAQVTLLIHPQPLGSHGEPRMAPWPGDSSSTSMTSGRWRAGRKHAGT